MNAKYVTLVVIGALLFSLTPTASGAAPRGGGGYRGGGGFDMHGDTASHSSTGPAGTSRTTTATNTGNGYNRTTTANNGNYNRTSSGGASSNGNYYHSSSGSNGYGGSHNSSTSGNVNSGNYNHNGSASGPSGSYNTSGSGNTYNHTYSGSAYGTNAYGQTYHSSTYVNNGYVYHGAVVGNPVYHGYPVWGWNGGTAWYPAPIYYGGGFWGPYAIGVTTAALYGSIVAANNATIASYQVQQSSPGAKLLSSYQLTQTPCGPAGLVVIYGPNSSVICAHPNQLVAAGNYSVNSSDLTIVSQNPA